MSVEIIESRKHHGIVYKITNLTNGKVYIGQTIRTIRDRWREHKSDVSRAGRPLYRALHKYGKENFSIVEIGKAYSQEELDLLEIHEILMHRSTAKDNGYNVDHGGNGAGTRSEETKKKISIAGRGRKMPIELREKLRAVHVGRRHSEESIAKMRQAKTGKILTAEHKAKIGKAGLGKKRSQESRDNISRGSIGKVFSAEHRANIAKSWIKRNLRTRETEGK